MNTFWVTLNSDLLNRPFQVKVSSKALKIIDKMGGVDNYLLYTSNEDLDSDVGVGLKKHLINLWEKKNGKKLNPRLEKWNKRLHRVANEERIKDEALKQYID